MQPDVVVVGAGVAGLGVAWRAAQRGLRVTVVDPSPGAGASHVAAGMLAPVTEAHVGEHDLLTLNLDSAGRWPAFAAELAEASGVDPALRAEGTLVVAFDADDHRALLDLHDFQRQLGLEVTRLRRRECRALEPGLSPAIRGGLFVAGDHQVDNRAVTAGLLAACGRAGVEVVRESARSVMAGDDGVRGVVTDTTTLTCATVVVAAGSWSARLEGLPEEARPPVRPVKGQILRLAVTAAEPVATHNLRALVEGGAVYLVPRAGGEVVVGATVEEQGFDQRVTAEAVHALLRDALDVLPALADAAVVETSAGLRPGTPDNGPVLGRSAVDGLLFATGHHRNGFLLLPVTADAVAAVAAGEDAPEVVAPFSPLRFVGEAVVAR